MKYFFTELCAILNLQGCKSYKYNFISNLLFRNHLSIYEKYILMCAYIRYLFNDNYGKTRAYMIIFSSINLPQNPLLS
jgi:hypothetical protein